MKIDIFDVRKMIEVNNLKPITNPILFDRNFIPTNDGLFSYDIFGRNGSETRKTTFAYIDLNGNYLNPIVYKILKRLNRNFEQCIAGIGLFKVDANGELVKADSEKDGWTGLLALYKHWDKLKFNETNSLDRTSRVKSLTSFKKSEIFQNAELVIPPYYRDADFSKAELGKVSKDEVNNLYTKLLRQASSLSKTSADAFSFIGDSTMSTIQNTLVEIYDYFVGYIKGKNGIFHQGVMGKSIDYGIRTVISSPMYKGETSKDNMVSLDRCGLPLVQGIVAFYPMIQKWVSDFLDREYGMKKFILDKDNKQMEIVDFAKQYNHDVIKKAIKKFIKLPDTRFETLNLTVKDDKGKIKTTKVAFKQTISIEGKDNIIQRPITWTDIFYMAVLDITKDKCVYITRYPLTNYLGIYPSKVSILSTINTEKCIIYDNVYTHYPIIDLNLPSDKIGNVFVDTLQIHPSIVGAMGADFDGTDCCH